VLDESFPRRSRNLLEWVFAESLQQFAFAFLFAWFWSICALCSVLRARDPLTIMFTVPLALFGAFNITLWIFDFYATIFFSVRLNYHAHRMGDQKRNFNCGFANQPKAQRDREVDEAIFWSAVVIPTILMKRVLSLTYSGILSYCFSTWRGRSRSRILCVDGNWRASLCATILNLFIIQRFNTTWLLRSN